MSGRAFAVASPTVWNMLSAVLHMMDHNYVHFRHLLNLKAQLFALCCCTWWLLFWGILY